MRALCFRLINDYAVKNKALGVPVHRIGADSSLHPQSFTCHKINNNYALCKTLRKKLKR